MRTNRRARSSLSEARWREASGKFMAWVRHRANTREGIDGREVDAGQEALLRALKAVEGGRCAPTVPAVIEYAKAAYRDQLHNLLRVELGEERSAGERKLRSAPLSIDRESIQLESFSQDPADAADRALREERARRATPRRLVVEFDRINGELAGLDRRTKRHRELTQQRAKFLRGMRRESLKRQPHGED